MSWRLLVAPVVALLVALVIAALPTEAAAHDWYTGLRAPDGSLCCNDRDCHQLGWSQVRRAPDGRLELQIEGRWLTVPFETILPLQSPNGHVHACWPQGGAYIRCVILPPDV